MDVSGEVMRTIAKELKLPPEQLRDDTRLADLGAQSLDVIEIVFALEETFDIDISIKSGAAPTSSVQGPANLSAFATVGDICRAVKALVDSKSPK